MKKWITLIACIIIISATTAHPWKANNYVIIDTDGGVDDMRAITLLLASPSIQILAITTSSGTDDANSTYWKVKSLLQQYNHQGILVGINSNNLRKYDFSKAHDFNWGDSIYDHSSATNSFIDALDRVATFSKEPVSFVNLGSLNTLNSYLQHNPKFLKRIKNTFWAVDSKLENSYNYNIDASSYSTLKEHLINLQLVSIPQDKYSYSKDIINKIAPLKGVYAKNYFRSIDGSEPHFLNLMYDELVALFLYDSNLTISSLTSSQIGDLLSRILTEESRTKNQTFSRFPTDTSAYHTDIGCMTHQTIEKFGEEEWSTCVLTSELHRHVGIYSLIGAKMGIRARTYFGCGPDELRIITHAGNKPPLSCMNDGIQVSTGATIGHGLITINIEEEKAPKAVFEYLGQKVVFELKPEYKKQLKKELKQLVAVYGISSDIYWDLVREIALNCWFNWDRNELFTITVTESVNS